ncbi:MAG: hypothetical protein C4308_10790 [Chitinophagaceae bacterium]
MLNDPYIEIINKTRKFNLPAKMVEETIQYLAKNGFHKTKFFLQENNVSSQQAGDLLKIIRTELRSTYKTNIVLYSVFAMLCLFVAAMIFWANYYAISFMVVFFLLLAIFFVLRLFRNISRLTGLRL